MVADDTADEELYTAWERGDERAANALIDRHLRSIGRFFVNKVTDAPDAEDLACRVFEVVSRNLGSFERNSSFRTYLFGIARNVLHEHFRRYRRERDHFDPGTRSVAEMARSPASSAPPPSTSASATRSGAGSSPLAVRPSAPDPIPRRTP